MTIQEIPRQEWQSFCESFTRQHQGLLVSIESVHPGEDPRLEVRESPLREVVFDPRSSGKGAIHIRTGGWPASRLIEQEADCCVQPTRLLFELTEAGEHVGLILEGAPETQTRLRFRVPFLPEALDGLLMYEAPGR